MWSISSWLLILTLVSCTHRSWLVPNIQRPNLAYLYCRVEPSLVTKELMCTSLDSAWKGSFYDNFFTWSQNWTQEFWLQNANSTSELSPHKQPDFDADHFFLVPCDVLVSLETSWVHFPPPHFIFGNVSSSSNLFSRQREQPTQMDEREKRGRSNIVSFPHPGPAMGLKAGAG